MGHLDALAVERTDHVRERGVAALEPHGDALVDGVRAVAAAELLEHPRDVAAALRVGGHRLHARIADLGLERTRSALGHELARGR